MYEQQFERMLRCYGHLQDTTVQQMIYLDWLYFFFQSCWNLKDWIKNDADAPVTLKADIENQIQNYVFLELCADLANGSKHLVQTRNIRRGAQLGASVEVFTGPNPYAIYDFFVTDSSGNRYEVLDVATHAIDQWKQLLAVYGISV